MRTEQLLKYWEKWMIAEDLTERTIDERIRFIRHVERVTGRSVVKVKRADLIDYMASDPDWSNTTKVHYRSALHTFFTWMQDEGYRRDNPGARLPKVKGRKRKPTPLTEREIQRVFNGGNYRRTRTMIALHYYLGLRVSEIARVHGRDIDWDERTLTTIGKGKKKIELPLADAMWTLVQSMPRDAYWFPNWKANKKFDALEGHILGNSVSTILSRAMKRAGVMGHRPHDLRASTATLQSQRGVDPFIVQENMRHQNMQTTAGYRLVDLDEQRDGFNSLPVMDMPTTSRRQTTARVSPIRRTRDHDDQAAA